MTFLADRLQSSELVDASAGTVDRRIFSDQGIYELELERIFARAWNFMAHDSQIPNPGDFFMTYIGEDRVIVVRDNEGNPQVLVNSCRHRGNAVCRAEEGHATSFMCTYHGWTYDLQGKLVGVPGFKEVYHEELERENWGLITAAHVDTYKGFIFATMDAGARSLHEYLGEVGRLSIDMLAVRGEIRLAAGIRKCVVAGNWKLATDNGHDMYHVPFSHAWVMLADRSVGGINVKGGFSGRSLTGPQTASLGGYGHALAGGVVPEKRRLKKNRKLGSSSERWRETPEAVDALGPAINSHGSSLIFPNFSISGYNAVLRLPRGAERTELWWLCFQPADVQEEKRASFRRKFYDSIGSAGLLEQDDVENWESATATAGGLAGRSYPLHDGMGRGHGVVIDDGAEPARIEANVNEYAQLWLYRNWTRWLDAKSWSELAKSRPEPTELPV